MTDTNTTDPQLWPGQAATAPVTQPTTEEQP